MYQLLAFMIKYELTLHYINSVPNKRYRVVFIMIIHVKLQNERFGAFKTNVFVTIFKRVFIVYTNTLKMKSSQKVEISTKNQPNIDLATDVTASKDILKMPSKSLIIA